MKMLKEAYGLNEVNPVGYVRGFFLECSINDYCHYFMITDNPDKALKEAIKEALNDIEDPAVADESKWRVYELPKGLIYLGDDTKSFTELNLKRVK